MKSSEFINWDNLKNIPFAECQVEDDKENKNIANNNQNEKEYHDTIK